MHRIGMEISFQLLQQQNPWWFREEVILDDEKIADYERETYQYFSQKHIFYFSLDRIEDYN